VAEVRALPQRRERTEAEEALFKDLAEFAEDQQEGSRVAGYVATVLYEDGSTRTASFRPRLSEDQEGNPLYMGRALFWAWARTALDKHQVFGEAVDAADHVLSGN